MSASVTFSGTNTYTLVLTDSTQGWTQNIVKNQSAWPGRRPRSLPRHRPRRLACSRLADFGTVNYSTSSANGTSLASHNPVEIIMVDNAGNDKDTTSAIGSGGAFSNTWLRSN